MPPRASLLLPLSAAALAVFLAGCDDKKTQASAAPAAPPPAEVGIVTLAPTRVAVTTELPGRTSPYRIAEVRPQVNGIVLKRSFTEGGDVEAGQQLYQVDAAVYQATYNSAQAALAKAQAQATSTKLLADRYRPLVAANAVSRQDFDNANAAYLQAMADIEAAKAQVESARINLVYTKVLSPISGRIGRSTVTEGALVTSGQSNALATVQQLDPIYVDVTQSSIQLLRLQRELADGKLQSAGPGQASVKLVLEDGTAYSETGMLQFSEATVNQGTGSVTLRAVFPNPKHELLPGMFVHAVIEEGVNAQAILVPQQGITRNQKGEPTAMVVGADNKVVMRTLKTDRAIGDKWLVSDGLAAGDRVIVQGIQKVRPGAEVRVVDQAASAAPASAAPAAAAPAAQAPAASAPASRPEAVPMTPAKPQQ